MQETLLKRILKVERITEGLAKQAAKTNRAYP